MDLSLLPSLKDQLLTSQRFGEIWEYFVHHFGEDPEFRAQGERYQSPHLEMLLLEIGEQVFGRPVSIHDVELIRLAEEGFVYGPLMMNDHLANVLYFEDITTGLLGVVWSLEPSEMKYARFRARSRQSSWEPSLN